MDQPAKQILLVENSKTARVSIIRKLSDIGYQVKTVQSGKEAVEITQQMHFDLIVMDLFLPELNGYEAAKLIRTLEKPAAKTPIFAYSSSDDPLDKERCKEVGIDEYILKSADHQMLIDKMTAYHI